MNVSSLWFTGDGVHCSIASCVWQKSGRPYQPNEDRGVPEEGKEAPNEERGVKDESTELPAKLRIKCSAADVFEVKADFRISENEKVWRPQVEPVNVPNWIN
ncbi:hypothetical protein ROZALSC1DRAFT_30845 [Rozella allomycis CSF55]|uniref:Uncharacterized protein n=1 Tax=Rozella allomycis (strain CSF55) TaxID=988480 RepID=A0A4P9YDF9_ROZAC|nr:hypothetical protein ROZALSC1DRAFT_30845 [Rozella allomycis CSF55]